MTPKEKAKEMIKTFDNIPRYAKKAVDEILNSSPSKIYWPTYDDETPSAIIYFEEVKQELENL